MTCAAHDGEPNVESVKVAGGRLVDAILREVVPVVTRSDRGFGAKAGRTYRDPRPA